MGVTCSSSHVQEKTAIISKERLDLVLIGKTGAGKSETGNTILRNKLFQSSFNTTSVTKEAKYEVTEYNGQIIKIVDTPGSGDTDKSVEESNKMVLESIARAVSMNPAGYHAFLFVVKFSDRFTKQDKEAIDLFHKILGEDYFKNYGILIVSYGDVFERHSEETKQSFEAYCKEQGGLFKDLLDECSKRYVLFDNTTKDVKKLNGQMKQLLNCINNLPFRGKRYTNDIFKQCHKAHAVIMITEKRKAISEETIEELSLILQKHAEIHKTPLKDQKKPLEQLLSRAKNLFEKVQKKDESTGVLEKVLEVINKTINDIENDIQLTQKPSSSEELKSIKETQQKNDDKTREIYHEVKSASDESWLTTATDVAKKGIGIMLSTTLPGVSSIVPDFVTKTIPNYLVDTLPSIFFGGKT